LIDFFVRHIQSCLLRAKIPLRERWQMEYCNAFIGKTDRPTEAEVMQALGPKAKLWNELIEWMS